MIRPWIDKGASIFENEPPWTKTIEYGILWNFTYIRKHFDLCTRKWQEKSSGADQECSKRDDQSKENLEFYT